MMTYFRKVGLKTFLPRALQYKSNELLEVDWHKDWLMVDGKKLCILQKSLSTEPKAVVILAHPYLAEAKLFYLRSNIVEVYLELNFLVVLFDFNGFGESHFSNFDFANDVSLMANYFSNKYSAIPIFGHGVSFGAAYLLSSATASNNPFKKIIIENCMDTNMTYYQKRNKSKYRTMRLLNALFPWMKVKQDYIEKAKNIKNVESLLLIYNTNDQLTTIEMGERIKSACTIPSILAIFNGDHLEAFPKNRELYKSTIGQFVGH